MYICNSIVAGKPLKALAVDCQTYLEQMNALNQDQIYTASLPFWQCVLNLLGDSKDPLLLTGSAMTEPDYLARLEGGSASFTALMHVSIMKSILCSVFGDFESGARLAIERGDSYEKKNGAPLVMLDFLHQGVALYSMARKTRKRKFIRKARKVKSWVSFWAKKVCILFGLCKMVICL